MAHYFPQQFLSEMIHFLAAAEVGPGPILAAVLALFVAAFTASVLLVGAAGFVAPAVLPPSFNTAYLFTNLALFFLGLLLMFLSVSVSRNAATPRSPQRRRSIGTADFLLSQALNVSIAAVFLSASVIIQLMDAERQG